MATLIGNDPSVFLSLTGAGNEHFVLTIDNTAKQVLPANLPEGVKYFQLLLLDAPMLMTLDGQDPTTTPSATFRAFEIPELWDRIWSKAQLEQAKFTRDGTVDAVLVIQGVEI